MHLGLGAFHRAHQAWYTAHAGDAGDWGIAAFTGRSSAASAALVRALRAQDGLYTLTVRRPDSDQVEVIDSIVAVHTADEVSALMRYLRDPAVGIVTLTVTEAGYRLDREGEPDAADPIVHADLAALCSGSGQLRSPLALLARGLDERRRAGAGAVAVMPCDNIPDNGGLVRSGLLAFAEAASTELATWIAQNVSFVSTSVDRITPRSSALDRAATLAAGFGDAVPVATEPFASWIISGAFPAGRPAWEAAGAQFVDDIGPYNDRKLWLLNGAHTGLANLGRSRGLATVAEATQDPECRELVEAFWSEAVLHLPGNVDATHYCRDLWERFQNPRIEHLLDQIAEDSLTKLRVRVVPVALAVHAAGGIATGSAGIVGAWVANVVAQNGRRDACDADIDVAREAADPVLALVSLAHPALADDARFVKAVRDVLAPAR